MPRKARVQTSPGVYHAILRGVKKQQIFEDDEDYTRFLDILQLQTTPEVNPTTGVAKAHCRIYAYCLMGNHLHLFSPSTNATQFQALPRPERKHYLYEAHEAGVGPRTLSRLTGVPYSIVLRATSGKTVNKAPSAIVSEPNPWDALYETYLDEGDFEQYPEY